MNPQQYYKRVTGILRPEILHERTVLIIGAGSGGARIATELGRLGVKLILADRPGEVLEEHNVIRHVLGYGSLGKPKTTELAAHIRSFNPDADIRTLECDAVTDVDTLEQLVAQHRIDVVLCCTDSPDSRHAINVFCVRHAIPMVAAGVYDGGVGGEVCRTSPGQACYACISTFTGDGRTRTSQQKSINYENPDYREAAATCALNLDITQITILQTKLTLQLLLPDANLTGLPSEVNVIRFANRVFADVFPRPMHAEFFVVEPLRDCLICGGTRQETTPDILKALADMGVPVHA